MKAVGCSLERAAHRLHHVFGGMRLEGEAGETTACSEGH
jgi:hypothetical protein